MTRSIRALLLAVLASTAVLALSSPAMAANTLAYTGSPLPAADGVVYTNTVSAAFPVNLAWVGNVASAGDLQCTLQKNFPLPATLPVDVPCAGAAGFPAPSGSFYVDVATAVDGEYEVKVAAFFANDSPLMVQLSQRVAVDKLLPVITIDPSATPTNDPSPSFTFSAVDQAPFADLAFDHLECQVTAQGVQPVPGDYVTCTSGSPLSDRPDGSYEFYVRATDRAGNSGQVGRSFTIDTIPPTLTILAPTPGQLVDAPNPDLNISSPDGAAVCRYDNEPYVPCDSAFANRTLPDGPHVLHVKATDAAGNVTEKSVAFTIDAFLGAPPKPQAASFSAGKAKKGKSGSAKRTLKVLIVPPDGVSPTSACKGDVTLSITGKISKKKSKTLRRKTSLTVSGSRCAASATFTLPKKFKRQKLRTRISFNGNAELGEFAFTGTIRN